MIGEIIKQVELAVDASPLAATEENRRPQVLADALAKVAIPALNFDDLSLALLTYSAGAALQGDQRRFLVIDKPLYFVEILTWLSYDTSIHNHPFSGVLRVLTGNSLNLTYDFQPVGGEGDVSWGNLAATAHRPIAPGSQFLFEAGTEFIHKVIHLGHDCCSLRIISRAGEERKQKQWGYRARGLALVERPDRMAQFLKRVPLLDHWYATARPVFFDAIERLFGSPFRNEALNYLAFVRAKHGEGLAAEKAIVESRFFSSAAKAKLIENFSTFSLETLPVVGPRLSADSELFAALLPTYGFSPELAHWVLASVASRNPVAWVTERLVELALSDRVVAGGVRDLLSRLARWEKGAAPEPIPTSFFGQAWRTVGFEGFLDLLKTPAPAGGWH